MSGNSNNGNSGGSNNGSKAIVAGRARGTVLKSDQPINFLGTVDKKTGRVGDGTHPLHEKSVGGAILVFPHGAGSSVGAYTIYSLKSYGTAPAAMVCKKADLTVATGCALADIPLITVGDGEFDGIRDGAPVEVDTGADPMIRPS